MKPESRPLPSRPQLESLATVDVRRHWLELIQKIQNYDLFMTVGFRCSLDLFRAQFSANHLLTRINRSLYGKHYKGHGHWLSGFGVIEFKLLSIRSWASPHFHLALKFPDGGSRSINMVEASLKKGAGRLRYPTHDADRPLGALISGSDFVDVRPVNDQSGLANYLCKDLGRGRRALDCLSIFFVDGDGFTAADPRPSTFRF